MVRHNHENPLLLIYCVVLAISIKLVLLFIGVPRSTTEPHLGQHDEGQLVAYIQFMASCGQPVSIQKEGLIGVSGKCGKCKIKVAVGDVMVCAMCNKSYHTNGSNCDVFCVKVV